MLDIQKYSTESINEDLEGHNEDPSLVKLDNNDVFGKPTPSPIELAEQYSVSIDTVLDAIEVGKKHELKEHTNDEVIAAEIARDHLKEDLNYYPKLELIEK